MTWRTSPVRSDKQDTLRTIIRSASAPWWVMSPSSLRRCSRDQTTIANRTSRCQRTREITTQEAGVPRTTAAVSPSPKSKVPESTFLLDFSENEPYRHRAQRSQSSDDPSWRYKSQDRDCNRYLLRALLVVHTITASSSLLPMSHIASPEPEEVELPPLPVPELVYWLRWKPSVIRLARGTMSANTAVVKEADTK